MLGAENQTQKESTANVAVRHTGQCCFSIELRTQSKIMNSIDSNGGSRIWDSEMFWRKLEDSAYYFVVIGLILLAVKILF